MWETYHVYTLFQSSFTNSTCYTVMAEILELEEFFQILSDLHESFKILNVAKIRGKHQK